MDITRRCDYAFRILRAAYNNGDSFVSVSDIAESEDIPYAFARSIQHDLVKGGLIKTVRGARGGLALNCDPAQVTLLEVLEAIQGPVSVSLCVIDSEYCEKQEGCAYNKLWQGADQLLNGYFGSITLKDLIEMGADHPAIEAAMSAGGKKSGRGSCTAACGCTVPTLIAKHPAPANAGGACECA